MLNFDRRTPQLLSEEILKKQRGVLLVVAFLLLVGGLMCLINPFATGTVLSIFVGVLLMLSGAGLIVGMFANRAQNTWPTIGGILLGIAYLLFGYVFITSPLAGFWRWPFIWRCCLLLAVSRAWSRGMYIAGCRETGCSLSSVFSIWSSPGR
ncbi:acid-resistance membrane protein [Raoultella planticola]|uniref:Acid-resistance membrane protein n=1 Tax=Raoultella planticola TaxID=575 RepID=A0A485CWI8_RAOPL|nr:acid-resistance membrane protein [Raoultella planticola]